MQNGFLTDAELEEKFGIKAQHAVATALKGLLQQQQTGWSLEETTPGSEEDLRGTDLYLIHDDTGRRISLDVSFRVKDSACAVLLRRRWFQTDGDNIVFRSECMRELIQAIKPALARAASLLEAA